MKIPVPVSYKHIEHSNESINDNLPSWLPAVSWCDKAVDDRYKNYYFGKNANSITSAQQFSIYRGSFRNLYYDDFAGLTLDDIQDSEYPLSDFTNDVALQSVGATHGLFATQIEANR